MISGVVSSGSGNASKAFTDKRKVEVKRIFGWEPYAGTLNLVTDLQVLNQLPEPIALTEHETAIGPLQWWPVLIHGYTAGAIVRGKRSQAPFIELVAPCGLRELGIKNGDVVSVEAL